MEIYELLMGNDVDLVDAISLVDYPAIEENWKVFNNNKNKYTISKFSDDKQIITGPIMIPNKLIYRYDNETNDEYYVWFKEETINLLSQKYMKEKLQYNTTIQHEKDIDNVFLFESWLVENPDNDKANELGYKVPKGTWMGSMKVNDLSIWKKIKSGDVKGFSIEGYFTDKLSKYSSNIRLDKMDDIEFMAFINDKTISDNTKNTILEKYFK